MDIGRSGSALRRVLPLGVIALLFAFVQCGGQSSPGPNAGSETHFLRACERSPDCGTGALECVCGVCTERCATANVCHARAATTRAVCVEPSCAVDEGYCDLPCGTSADCTVLGPEHRCDGGFCRGARLAASPDASASGGMSGQAGSASAAGAGALGGAGGSDPSAAGAPSTGGAGGSAGTDGSAGASGASGASAGASGASGFGGAAGAAGAGGSGGLVCAPPPATPLAWWTFDGNLLDRVGMAEGALVGTASVEAAGHVDGGLRLSTAGDAVEVPDQDSLDIDTGDFSILFWIRTTATGIVVPLDKRSLDGAVYRGYSVHLDEGAVGMQLADGVGDPSYSNIGANVAPLVNDGLWHLVTVTVDRDNADGVAFYVDGVLARTGNPMARTESLANDAPLLIGRRSVDLTGGFAGEIDELMIVSGVLSPADVAAAYAAGTEGYCRQ